MINLDPFKLAGNYSQKSGNPISEILILNISPWGMPQDHPSSAVPLPPLPIDFLLLRPWFNILIISLKTFTSS